MDNSKIPPDAMFDAISWAQKSIWEAQFLEDETLQSIAGFTLLWNIFEGCICNNRANINTFDNIACGLTYTLEIQRNVDESISYYNCRYVDGDKMRPLFDDLKFRKNDRKEFVAGVLRERDSNISHKVLALLIIVYRIRNNIFHGEKPAGIWNGQAENISKSSCVLSTVIKASGLSS